MKLYLIYFSPTGGTKNTARMIGNVWDCEKEEIDLLNSEIHPAEYEFTPEDICLIAVPSFSGRVPDPALKQLRAMRGNGARAVLTAVYGNRDFDDTLLELKDTLDAAGFYSAAAIAAVAEHSIFRNFAAGRPDKKDQKELEGFGAQIIERLNSGREGKELTVPGNHPYRPYMKVPLKPRGGKACTQCGKCAARCPVQAIPKEKPASVSKDRCISCMHCITVCPEHARRNSRLLSFAGERMMKKSCGGRKGNVLF